MQQLNTAKVSRKKLWIKYGSILLVIVLAPAILAFEIVAPMLNVK